MDEVGDFRGDLETLRFPGRPVVAVGPHPVQALLNLRIAAGESSEQLAPSRSEQLSGVARRILLAHDGSLDVSDELRPVARGPLLQLRRPQRATGVDLLLRAFRVVL